MSNDKDELVDLAASISDGKDVDWERADAVGCNPQTLENLKTLDNIIRSHHSVQSGPENLTGWGPLQIIRHLASGSYGEVYRAYDPALDRDVALKLLRKETVDSHDHCLRLLQEGRNLAQVKHENVATIYGAEEHDGRVGIWMELIEGDTLARIGQDRGLFGGDEALLVAVTICRALTAVHGAGQAHGDIKAQNIMREVGGRLVLTDFGSGSCLGDSESLVSGTPLYLAPEVLRGQAPTVASDIYSVGVLLFHLLTGRFPREANTLTQLKEVHLAGQTNLLRDLQPDLPRETVSAVERALESRPDNRFTSAGHMEHALQQCLGGDAASDSFVPRRTFVWSMILTIAVFAAVFFMSGRLGFGGDYRIESTLYRSNDQGIVALESGGSVAPRDRLFIELEASKNLYVYILNQDDRGDAWILFPMQNQALQNPLSANTRHRLPGAVDGQPFSWQVTTAGGVEHFLVIASPEPMAQLEETIARLATSATSSGALPLDSSALEVFRGVGGLVREQTGPEAAAGDLFENVEQMIVSQGGIETSGVWVRRIDLINTGF